MITGTVSFALRLATPEDSQAVAEVQTATWKVAYAGLMPREYLAALSAEERQPVWRAGIESHRYSIVLAEQGSRLIGFSAYAKSRDSDNTAGSAGEIQAIYVLQSHWGAGAGRALLEFSEGALRSAGFKEITLWVLDGNERARSFYERHGFAPDGAEKREILKARTEIRELRYRKSIQKGKE